MATKPQAKTGIDNAAAAIKADIDNILPTGVDIQDGQISFGPTKYILKLNANGNAATALSWYNTIKTNLTNASRPFVEKRRDRRIDPENPNPDTALKHVMIIEASLTIMIVNF